MITDLFGLSSDVLNGVGNLGAGVVAWIDTLLGNIIGIFASE